LITQLPTFALRSSWSGAEDKGKGPWGESANRRDAFLARQDQSGLEIAVLVPEKEAPVTVSDDR
jgi:hypothetical protein